MWLPNGRYRIRILAEAATKSFADIGNLLTTLLSPGLSKDIDSTLLNTRYKAKNNATTFLTNLLYFGTGSRSVPNRCRSFPPECTIVPSVGCLRKGFLLQVTHGLLYDMIKMGNREAELKLSLSLHSYFSVFSCLSSPIDTPR